MKHWLSKRPAGSTPRAIGATTALLAVLAIGLLATATPAQAGPTVQLQATATSELPNNEMVVQLAVERDGTVAEKLNDEVLAALNLALAKVKTVNGVKARLGSITTQPSYDQQGKRNGWRVRGVIVLEGEDLRATGALAGELSTDLQIAGVSFRLTDAARTREEARLLKEAAAAFNQRAGETAAAFGFSSFDLRSLNINHAPGDPPRPMQMEMRANAMSSKAFVPTEGGDATVTLTISGSVELK
jgi:predicted secreted protein